MCQAKFVADHIIFFFFFFSEKTSLDISCKSSAKQLINSSSCLFEQSIGLTGYLSVTDETQLDII